MYTLKDIEKMNEKKRKMIINYINKFIESRWRDKETYTIEKCLQFLIVQNYIECVDNLPITKEVDSIMNVGCGGTCQ